MSRLNYRHLYYFWRVAVVGKLTEVADELHIAQSALSAQIKQLEDQIGLPLFHRQNRKLTLTDEGKKVLRYADEIFTVGNELEKLIKRGVPTETQHLSIGVLNNLSRNFIEGFVSPMLSMPQVSFSLEVRGLENLLKGLSNQDFDVILTNRTIASLDEQKLWKTQLVARQPIAVVGPATQKSKDRFPKGFEGSQWILPGPKTEIRSAFEAWCAVSNYQPDIKAEAGDMAMLRLLARDSGALAVLPPVVVKDEIALGTLEVYELIPNAFENFYAIANNKKYENSLISGLVKSGLSETGSTDQQQTDVVR